MDNHDVYDNPLVSRYASTAMAELWSGQRRYATWRRLWLALAEAQRSLGLPISAEQIAEMAAHLEDIDFAAVAHHEKRLRHDVMAHVHVFGEVAPLARPIIHLGATSCYVTDNADLILLRDALGMVRDGLVRVIDAMGHFIARWRDLPCLGYTHFQPAQLVTVGKRATLWCQDLLFDLQETERRIQDLKFLGVKGTTGTQASFLALFHGDHDRVEELDRQVARAFRFTESYPVTGQTYPRKVDSFTLCALGAVAESAHRFGCDLRLLAHEREVEEPFETEQVGSSAMAYKRNPMRAERMCSLARFVLAQQTIVSQTAANQWLERTLDDSAARRLALPQAFLGVDALLRLYQNVVPGLEVNEAVVASHVAEHLPFMATENMMMAGVEAGGDRQDLHERIRAHSLAATQLMKEGHKSDLIERIRKDRAFPPTDWQFLLEPRRYTGRSAQQVDAFLSQCVEPVRGRYPHLRAGVTTLHV